MSKILKYIDFSINEKKARYKDKPSVQLQELLDNNLEGFITALTDIGEGAIINIFFWSDDHFKYECRLYSSKDIQTPEEFEKSCKAFFVGKRNQSRINTNNTDCSGKIGISIMKVGSKFSKVYENEVKHFLELCKEYSLDDHSYYDMSKAKMVNGKKTISERNIDLYISR